MQFLPVYVPSEEEKKDAALFARNVRAVMARYCPTFVYDSVPFQSSIGVAGSAVRGGPRKLFWQWHIGLESPKMKQGVEAETSGLPPPQPTRGFGGAL